MPSIHWLPWSADAFARAREESKPVLLSISAAWCHWCHEMDRTTYTHPGVAAIVNTHFVPVRVDADRRPDISERYTIGGLPTTSFLTPEGDVIAGGNFVPPERMAGVLEQVCRAFLTRARELAERAAQPGEPAEALSDASDPQLIAQVFETYDGEYGGFGTEPKFPLTAPLLLALDLYRESRDPVLRSMVETTLDAMAGGGLYDHVDGGFFRYATTREWQLPHEEKLLDVNAAQLRAYLDAWESLHQPRFLECARGVLKYLAGWLQDPAGGWWGSQHADHAYYLLQTVEARRAAVAPAVDRTMYSGWNGTMASALLHASRALEEDTFLQAAVATLERVLLNCYAPGRGVAHYFEDEPTVRGLLEDQVALIEASLDAHDATGDITYEMMAEELGHFVLRAMYDSPHGGFFDRAPAEDDEVGLLRRRVKPFGANCEAARALRRLAHASGESEFEAAAAATLGSMRLRAHSQGTEAARFLLAIRGARVR